jgi:hypothetical protein
VSNNPNKPVVALDIDGTLGMYHLHFEEFAEKYIGRPIWADWKDKRGEFSDALGLEKELYRQIKLAYRQGGQKRTMPAFPHTAELVAAIREAGAEVWCCTTRPWQRLDNIDPDTREWFRRAGVEFDGVIFGENKYQELANIVGTERVAAILEDEPEQYVIACNLFGNKVPILRFGAHNVWWRQQSVWYAGAEALDQAEKAILHKLKVWKDDHMPKPQACRLEDCSIPLPHTHGTDDSAIINPLPMEGNNPGYEHETHTCYWYETPEGPARFFEQQDTSFLYRCREQHVDKMREHVPPVGRGAEHTTGMASDDDLPGQWSHSDFEGGDPDERSYAERQAAYGVDRGDFGMPGLGAGWSPGPLVQMPTDPTPVLTWTPGVLDLPAKVWAPSEINISIKNGEMHIDYGGEKGNTLALTSQGERVARWLLEAIQLFVQKNSEYGEPTGDDLGAAGQYADMHRKWKKLKRVLWDNQPDAVVGENIEQVLMDFVGHLGLTADFLHKEDW